LVVYLSGFTKPYVHDVFMEIEFLEKGPLALAVVRGEAFPTIGAFYDAILDAFTQSSPPISPNNLAYLNPRGAIQQAEKVGAQWAFTHATTQSHLGSPEANTFSALH
jgi:hypothetical protein